MLNEAVFIVEQFLSDSTYGVNARLNLIPRRPQDAPPRPLAIYSDLSDVEIAGDRDPTKVPALVILADETADSSRESEHRPAVEYNAVDIFITHVDRETDPLKAKLEGGTYQRAIIYTLRALKKFRDDPASGVKYREVNGILLVDVKSWSQHRATASAGRTDIFGFVQARLHLQDRLSP